MDKHHFFGLWLNGFHRINYLSWGKPVKDKTVIAVHGLTRNAHDFDFLAHYLSKAFHVVCPDIVGRGDSEWLPNKTDYGYPLYLSDMATLIAKLNVESVNWIGTSMGGIIGMMLAAQRNTPIKKLIINDVGSHISAQSLLRLSKYVGVDPEFNHLHEAEAYFRKTYNSFGPLTDEQWRHMTVNGVFKNKQGYYQLKYDPAIANVFNTKPIIDVDLSYFWLKINCPVLLIRGEESDLLPRSTVNWMKMTKPSLQVVEFAQCGHAPHLMSLEHVKVIENFLNE
ncbi:MAG: alpha/beta hydrolase [Betaproteobacteria bacterium]|nr:alpha/beta hydrolase [Betaproteobacteria bacterium]